MAHAYITCTMATDDEDLNYLGKYGHRSCFVLEIDVCNWVAMLFKPVKWAICWRRLKMDFLDIYCLFFRFILQWSLVREYATNHYSNRLCRNLVIHICLARPQWAKGYVSKTWSLYISRFKTDFPVKCREYAHSPITYASRAAFPRSLSLNHSLKLLKYVQTGLRHNAICNSLGTN